MLAMRKSGRPCEWGNEFTGVISWVGNPGATDVPRAGERVSVCPYGMAVDGRAVVGSALYYAAGSSPRYRVCKEPVWMGGIWLICIPH